MQLRTPFRAPGIWMTAIALIATFVCCAWYFSGRSDSHANPRDNHADQQNADGKVVVECVSPRPGGIDRVCLQPGSVEPFEAADLYTKVSGFLIEQKVDIGYAVKFGDILARIAAPDLEKQVKQDAAEIERAKARVEQMDAAITTAEADLGAATAAIALAQAEQKSKVSFRNFREKQLERIRDLVSRMAIDAKLADEHEDHYQSAVSAELASFEAIAAAKQKESAARARVKQAEADLRYAKAEVETAKARLEKSQAILDFTVIRSPYTGVVTKRNFHPGDFVRSADSGGDRIPVLAVERTDIMRVVVQVPERDVPFVDLGDPAIVEIDALPGVVFTSRNNEKVVVSRLAASEDPHTRVMRTEVHVKNPEGKLRRGMFGRVNLLLQVGAPTAFRIPSAALSGKAEAGKGMIRVVRNDKVAIVPIHYGADNGVELEVLTGLAAGDRVILHATEPVTDGMIVTVTEAKERKSGH
jgi:HlyD family secretion protein